MIKEKIYNVGIYTRLSNDDERKGESLSIENQKSILTEYAAKEGWNIHLTYVDDGYSGTNFERPGFKQMLADIKNGDINLVLCKDLSRLGRNHVQVGHFIEDILPAFGCRFVAVNNNVDTLDANNSSNDMIGFLNLFNEFHSRETSKKVKTVRKSCAERGMFLGTYAPFGYKKSPEDRHKLIIDAETAPIVQRMFRIRCKGSSYRSIATLFNEEHIISPRELYYQRKKEVNPQKENGLWNASTVRKILLSEVYIGNLVQGKVGTLSYKSKKIIRKDEDEWIRVENTHEPLITEEEWNQICALEEKSYRPRKRKSDNKRSVFTGLLVCADCDFNMRGNVERGTRKNGTEYEYVSFMCGNYSRSGKTACTTHTIYENALTEIVLEEIKSFARAVSYDENAVINRILKLKHQETTDKLALYQNEVKANEVRIKDLQGFVEQIYTDRMTSKISEATFGNLMSRYDEELQTRIKSSEEMQKQLKACEETVYDVSKWANTIKQYVALETLEQEVLLELIDKIEVGEAIKVDGKRICDIKIIYRMVGDLTGISEESEVDADETHGKQAL